MPMNSITSEAAQWHRLKAVVADALERPPHERADFLRQASGGDPAVHLELEELMQAASIEDSPLDAPPAREMLEALDQRAANEQASDKTSERAEEWTGRRLGAYKVRQLIARGGMGEVYLGERADGHYDQRVAIKLMRDPDSSFMQGRFDAERRILASLDHPHLAKLLDAGHTAEGLPYFVMELVDGQPIDAYCEERKLGIDDRLALFRSICEVVQYAHSKGVIHRDLKPANILVTRDGVVKLVDFGIAKQVAANDADNPATATAQRVLTPEYASPEQVRGESASPASDIYALGVVLYRLLTGTSPYGRATGDPYALTRAICDTDPPPPSRAEGDTAALPRRGLRGDLDAVVMMALRKDPAKRYPSAQALADDIFRHLERLPVKARAGALSYRAGRFALRHRGLLAGVVAANIALVAGVAVATYEAWQARQERERAERHFADVRKLANVMMVQVHGAIRDLPGSTPARQLIVQNALGYLEKLSADASGDSALKTELAAGYRNIGDIQGRPGLSNLGDMKGALASYERGIALVTPLAADAAGNQRPAQQELATLSARKGDLQIAMGNPQGAEASLRTGVAVADSLARADGTSMPVMRIRALLYCELAQVEVMLGKQAAFMERSAEATAQLQKIMALAPGDLGVINNLATLRAIRGGLLMGQDLSASSAQLALNEFRQVVALVAPPYEHDRNNVMLAHSLGAARLEVGRALLRLGNKEEALAEEQRGLAIIDALATADSKSVLFRVDRAWAQSQLSDAWLADGDVVASIAAARSAVDAADALPEDAASNMEWRYVQAESHYRLAQALRAQGSADGRRAACEHLAQSLPMLEEVQQKIGLHADQVNPKAVRQTLSSCS
jgi:tRNA A-37 threonylcarbamoyl transferase component Bud32/tetratricopeptide (TPR) repeat protein